jgi:hypothetical protein
MNVYNARIFKEQHKENNPEKWRVCDICNEEKNIWQFSLLDKTRTTSIERKTTCKNCSAAYKEKERRNRNWKFEAKKVLYNNAKQRAKKSNIEFTLTKDDIDIPDICPVFGFPLKREKRETWMCAPSIDRIDNTKGYIKENIIIVSRRANILKKDATIQELRKLADYYEHFCDKSISGGKCNYTSGQISGEDAR